MWRLCVDQKGNLIRAPHEIENGWSLEAVYDAHAVLDMMGELIAEANKPPKVTKPKAR